MLETLFFVAVFMAHLSRWAEDLIIYSSGLFKFVQCSDAYATGAPPAQAPGKCLAVSSRRSIWQCLFRSDYISMVSWLRAEAALHVAVLHAFRI